MWQRFTERARRAVFFAQGEAARLGDAYVSTEHMLLGLICEDDSFAVRILDKLGASRAGIRSEIERQATRGDAKLGADMQLTPRGKRTIDLAYEEAESIGSDFIGTEHLLLGLVREAEGLAGRVLAKLGIELEAARQEVRLVQGGGAVPAAGAAAHPDALSLHEGERAPKPALGGKDHWERFTEQARQMVFFAQVQAERHGSAFVSTEHLLLGIVGEHDSVAARILDRMGISLIQIRVELERQVTRGDGSAGADLPLTPRTKRVIELSYIEARQLNNNYIRRVA